MHGWNYQLVIDNLWRYSPLFLYQISICLLFVCLSTFFVSTFSLSISNPGLMKLIFYMYQIYTPSILYNSKLLNIVQQLVKISLSNNCFTDTAKSKLVLL